MREDSTEEARGGPIWIGIDRVRRSQHSELRPAVGHVRLALVLRPYAVLRGGSGENVGPCQLHCVAELDCEARQEASK